MKATLRNAVSTAFALMLALCAVGCASMRDDVAKAEPLAATPSGVALNRPQPGLYTAGQPAASDWRAIADAGVHTVVNLRTATEMAGRDERAEVAATGMRYIEIPIDGPGGITPENAQRLRETLAAAGGDVLVHCASANRAGGLLAVALAQQGVVVDEALAIGRAAGMKSTEARATQVIGASSQAVCAAEPASGGNAATRCPAAP
ncbi:MAG: hypothetical protein KA144_14425 [Xanthomonadaceae bacterium]|nr:hypothetical protein [Xanthomonadaceae bacterium]